MPSVRSILLVISDKHSAANKCPPRASIGSLTQQDGFKKSSNSSCKSHNWKSNPRDAQYRFSSAYSSFKTPFSLWCSFAVIIYRTILQSFSVRRLLNDGFPYKGSKLSGNVSHFNSTGSAHGASVANGLSDVEPTKKNRFRTYFTDLQMQLQLPPVDKVL